MCRDGGIAVTIVKSSLDGAVRIMSMSDYENSFSARFRCILSSIEGGVWKTHWRQNRCSP